MSRVLVWVSSGAASMVVAKMVLASGRKDVELLRCETGNEDEDNYRFETDCAAWIGREITVIRSTEYADVPDVWERRRFMVSPHGAPCTTHMKVAPRLAFQRPDDVHVFGYGEIDVSTGLNAKSTGRIDFDSETFVCAPDEAVAFTVSEQANGFAWGKDVYPTLDAQLPSDGSNIQKGVRQGWRVRRLTPRECERLQGFPDGYTDIVYNRRNHTPDGPRYKALGNSMAVNVMRWIGRRIDMIRSLDVS